MIFSCFISLLRTSFSLLFLTLKLFPLLSSFPLFFLPFACYLSLFTYFFLSLFTLFSLLHSCIYCLFFFLFHLGVSFIVSFPLLVFPLISCHYVFLTPASCFVSFPLPISFTASTPLFIPFLCFFSSHFLVSHLCLHCLFPLNISCPSFLATPTPLWSQLFFFSCFILWFLSLFPLLFLFPFLFIFLYLLLSLFPLLCFLPSHLISFPCVLGMSFLLLFPLYVFPLLSLLLSLNFPLLSSVSLLP